GRKSSRRERVAGEAMRVEGGKGSRGRVMSEREVSEGITRRDKMRREVEDGLICAGRRRKLK
ncbi:hypothetical protein, partial [Paraburkholderia sp. Cy-641]|uniref:hypothetical protein n=1 Tax=Paraburkholderia sp. Cy-641 TaxID=2608337 RepID=UPI0019629EA7